MPDLDCDPARRVLPPRDYESIRMLAAGLVDAHGRGGPPFPVTQLWAFVSQFAEIERLLPAGKQTEAGAYGCTVALDPRRHAKHALILLDTAAAPDEVFLTLFHETAHVLLHIVDDPEALTGLPFLRRHGPPRSPGNSQAEVEANLFTRLSTMPAGWVRQHWPYARALSEDPAEACRWMAQLFGVPVPWMLQRLRALHLWPDL